MEAKQYVDGACPIRGTGRRFGYLRVMVRVPSGDGSGTFGRWFGYLWAMVPKISERQSVAFFSSQSPIFMGLPSRPHSALTPPKPDEQGVCEGVRVVRVSFTHSRLIDAPCQFLIQLKQLGHALTFRERGLHGKSVGLHHGAVVLLMGAAQFHGHGEFVVEVGKRGVRV